MPNTESFERPYWQQGAAVLIPLAGVALGGGTARWNQALILVAVGTLLLLAPPRVSAGRTIHWLLAGLLLLAGTAFLPARWFFVPPWRTALGEDFDVTLPATLSPQPVLAAESGVLFVAGMAWFYLMLTFQWRAEKRLRAGRIFGGGVVALGALFLVLYRLDIVPSIWHNERHYGPFPNRNQSADFLAVGSLVILACAQGRWHLGHRLEAAGWLLGLGVVTVSLFASYSRAGVVLFFAEVAAYLLVETWRAARRRSPVGQRPVPLSRRRGVRWAALSFSLVLLLATLVLLFGGSTLERFRLGSAQGKSNALTSDFRVGIQSDALHMVAAGSWCGVGIGSFSEIFPLFRRQSASPSRALHPESDYLWAASELGWPALLLIGGGVMVLAARVARSVQTSGKAGDRRLRLAAGIGLAAFVLHGFVDVSAHRLGTLLSAGFLLGLALKDEPTGQPGLGGFATTVFRALGLLLLAVGAMWLSEARGTVFLPGQNAVDSLRARAEREIAAKDYAAAEDDFTRALRWAPLDWRLYSARALARVYLGGDREQIAADFRRARYLEPFQGEVPNLEAVLWETAGERTPAVSALGEACRREPGRVLAYLGNVMQAGRSDQIFLDELARYCRHDPALLVAFFQHCDTPETAAWLAAAVSEDPNLDRLSDPQKTAIFQDWAIHGDRAALVAAMPLHPAWQRVGWRWWAFAAAGTGDLEQACTLAARWTPKPTLPSSPPNKASLEEMLRRASQRPASPVAALQAYRAATDAGDWSSALLGLQQITSQPDCPNYFQYLKASACGQVGDWQGGWDAWRQYLAAARIQV